MTLGRSVAVDVARILAKSADDLLIDASEEAFSAAGVTKDDVDAYWLGTAMSGASGMALARPLQLQNKPVSRVENFCATGSEALRGAAYAVASGAYDVAMVSSSECIVLWAIPDWATWASFEQAWAPDGALAACGPIGNSLACQV